MAKYLVENHKLSHKVMFVDKECDTITLREPTVADVRHLGLMTKVNADGVVNLDMDGLGKYIADLTVAPVEGMTEDMVNRLPMDDFIYLAMTVANFLAAKMQKA